METTENLHKKLYRSRSDRIIAGVCGGLGKYFEIDSLIFRILFLIFVFGGGFGILLYIVLLLIIPNEPLISENPGNPDSKDSKDFKEKVNDFAEQVRQNANELAREAKDSRGSRSIRNILGIFIVAFGIFLLFSNLFPYFVRWDLFWPLAIIFVGILIISRRR